MLIALNALFIGITSYYQPYLTDDEFLRIKRFGRKQANVQRNKKCTKQGFGVNNNLDILLLIGETCICTASLIAHNFDLAMQSEAEEFTPVANNTNATLQQDPLAERIAKQYPVGNAIITTLDFLGLIVFFSGFLYFSKFIFVHLCGKCCIQRYDRDASNEVVEKHNNTKIVPT